MMKIKEITKNLDYNCIIFDNGYKLTTYHAQDCCETNYADFSQLEDTGILNEEFDENLPINIVDEQGFLIQAKSGYSYFVPCYSEQNGYYRNDLSLTLINEVGLTIKYYVLECALVFC